MATVKVKEYERTERKITLQGIAEMLAKLAPEGTTIEVRLTEQPDTFLVIQRKLLKEYEE